MKLSKKKEICNLYDKTVKDCHLCIKFNLCGLCFKPLDIESPFSIENMLDWNKKVWSIFKNISTSEKCLRCNMNYHRECLGLESNDGFNEELLNCPNCENNKNKVVRCFICCQSFGVLLKSFNDRKEEIYGHLICMTFSPFFSPLKITVDKNRRSFEAWTLYKFQNLNDNCIFCKDSINAFDSYAVCNCKNKAHLSCLSLSESSIHLANEVLLDQDDQVCSLNLAEFAKDYIGELSSLENSLVITSFKLRFKMHCNKCILDSNIFCCGEQISENWKDCCICHNWIHDDPRCLYEPTKNELDIYEQLPLCSDISTINICKSVIGSQSGVTTNFEVCKSCIKIGVFIASHGTYLIPKNYSPKSLQFILFIIDRVSILMSMEKNTIEKSLDYVINLSILTTSLLSQSTLNKATDFVESVKNDDPLSLFFKHLINISFLSSLKIEHINNILLYWSSEVLVWINKMIPNKENSKNILNLKISLDEELFSLCICVCSILKDFIDVKPTMSIKRLEEKLNMILKTNDWDIYKLEAKDLVDWMRRMLLSPLKILFEELNSQARQFESNANSAQKLIYTKKLANVNSIYNCIAQRIKETQINLFIQDLPECPSVFCLLSHLRISSEYSNFLVNCELINSYEALLKIFNNLLTLPLFPDHLENEIKNFISYFLNVCFLKQKIENINLSISKYSELDAKVVINELDIIESFYTIEDVLNLNQNQIVLRYFSNEVAQILERSVNLSNSIREKVNSWNLDSGIKATTLAKKLLQSVIESKIIFSLDFKNFLILCNQQYRLKRMLRPGSLISVPELNLFVNNISPDHINKHLQERIKNRAQEANKLMSSIDEFESSTPAILISTQQTLENLIQSANNLCVDIPLLNQFKQELSFAEQITSYMATEQDLTKPGLHDFDAEMCHNFIQKCNSLDILDSLRSNKINNFLSKEIEFLYKTVMLRFYKIASNEMKERVSKPKISWVLFKPDFNFKSENQDFNLLIEKWKKINDSVTLLCKFVLGSTDYEKIFKLCDDIINEMIFFEPDNEEYVNDLNFLVDARFNFAILYNSNNFLNYLQNSERNQSLESSLNQNSSKFFDDPNESKQSISKFSNDSKIEMQLPDNMTLIKWKILNEFISTCGKSLLSTNINMTSVQIILLFKKDYKRYLACKLKYEVFLLKIKESENSVTILEVKKLWFCLNKMRFLFQIEIEYLVNEYKKIKTWNQQSEALIKRLLFENNIKLLESSDLISELIKAGQNIKIVSSDTTGFLKILESFMTTVSSNNQKLIYLENSINELKNTIINYKGSIEFVLVHSLEESLKSIKEIWDALEALQKNEEPEDIFIIHFKIVLDYAKSLKICPYKIGSCFNYESVKDFISEVEDIEEIMFSENNSVIKYLSKNRRIHLGNQKSKEIEKLVKPLKEIDNYFLDSKNRIIEPNTAITLYLLINQFKNLTIDLFSSNIKNEYTKIDKNRVSFEDAWKKQKEKIQMYSQWFSKKSDVKKIPITEPPFDEDFYILPFERSIFLIRQLIIFMFSSIIKIRSDPRSMEIREEIMRSQFINVLKETLSKSLSELQNHAQVILINLVKVMCIVASERGLFEKKINDASIKILQDIKITNPFEILNEDVCLQLNSYNLKFGKCPLSAIFLFFEYSEQEVINERILVTNNLYSKIKGEEIDIKKSTGDFYFFYKLFKKYLVYNKQTNESNANLSNLCHKLAEEIEIMDCESEFVKHIIKEKSNLSKRLNSNEINKNTQIVYIQSFIKSLKNSVSKTKTLIDHNFDYDTFMNLVMKKKVCDKINPSAAVNNISNKSSISKEISNSSIVETEDDNIKIKTEECLLMDEYKIDSYFYNQLKIRGNCEYEVVPFICYNFEKLDIVLKTSLNSPIMSYLKKAEIVLKNDSIIETHFVLENIITKFEEFEKLKSKKPISGGWVDDSKNYEKSLKTLDDYIGTSTHKITSFIMANQHFQFVLCRSETINMKIKEYINFPGNKFGFAFFVFSDFEDFDIFESFEELESMSILEIKQIDVRKNIMN